MKWLTQTEIYRASRSKKKALACSQEHWRQLSTATAKELREAACEGRIGTDDSWCAFCKHDKAVSDYRLCSACPVKAAGTHFRKYYCVLAWRRADTAFDSWLHRGGSWHAWKKASKAMYEFLMSIEV